jgi:Fic family protein
MTHFPIKENKFGYTVSLDDFFKGNKSVQNAFLLEEIVYQSNLIEGIDKGWIETVREDQKMPELAPVLSDHVSCYNYVLENFKGLPTTQDILMLHKMLTQRIFAEKADEIVNRKNMLTDTALHTKAYYCYNSGAFRKSRIYVGNPGVHMRGCLHFQQIPTAMNLLEEKVDEIKKDPTTEEKIWNLHHEFESIHPFIDGNGRVGRMLLNWLSLHYLNKFIIVLSQNKNEYYHEISKYAEQYKRENPQLHFYKDIISKDSMYSYYLRK